MRHKRDREYIALLTILIVSLSVALLIAIGHIISRNGFEAGYQACIEEYNLYWH